MDDKSFLEAGLKLSICPSESRWPRPNVHLTRNGDRFIAHGLNWEFVHQAVQWLREHATNTIAEVNAVNADKNLSTTGKRDKKRMLVRKAADAIQKSKVVAQAKDSTERQLSKWNEAVDAKLKLAVTAHTATIYNAPAVRRRAAFSLDA